MNCTLKKGQGSTRKDKFIKGMENKRKGMIQGTRVKSNQLAEKLSLQIWTNGYTLVP